MLMVLELNKVYNENCLDTMKRMADNSVDSVVTDPPYGLKFMDKKWDCDVPSTDIWKEVFRVLKPGGHLLSFGGTRTYHRMVCNIEDAGFEIRNQIAWVFSSGFPKSMDISKQMDKEMRKKLQYNDFSAYIKRQRELAGITSKELSNHFPSKNNNVTGCIWNWENGNIIPTIQQYNILKKLLNLDERFDDLINRREYEREVIGARRQRGSKFDNIVFNSCDHDVEQITIPIRDDSKQWYGWGTDLKPAYEPICVARKPLEGTVAQNVLKYGTGGLNIDGCRIPSNENLGRMQSSDPMSPKYGFNDNKMGNRFINADQTDRFPANFIHDGSDDVLELFPDSKGQRGDLKNHSKEIQSPNGIYGKFSPRYDALARNDVGSAARFFYCAKTNKTDRNEGTEHLNLRKIIGHNRFDQCSICGGYILQNPDRPSACQCENPVRQDNAISGNYHPTVKPTSLMMYLCRLVTPPGGIIYDPFAGSGSTGKAAVIEGFEFVGSELDSDYVEISNARIKYAIENRHILIDEYKLDHLEKVMSREIPDNDYF